VMRRSFDGGATFDDMRQIEPIAAPPCPGPAPTGECTPYPGVVAGPLSGTVYLVWHDPWNGGAPQVQFSSSLDFGITFSQPLNISQAPVDAHCASMKLGPDGRLLVAYEQGWSPTVEGDFATLVQSTDGGNHFSSPVVVYGSTSGTSVYPSPAEGIDGTIVVGWEDNTA